MSDIECKKNGPYLAKNLKKIIGSDGKEISPKPTLALCRCGLTKEKPFCDGTHVKAGFKSDRLSDGKDNERKDYKGIKITIHDNRSVCSHAGFCTEELSSVFGGEVWAKPDADSVEKIKAVIKKCPSGALSYSEGAEEFSFKRDVVVKVVPNGPLSVEGGVDLKDTDFGEKVTKEHYTLCRCGGSKNKPFCDGTHWHQNFRDDSLLRVATPSDLKEGKPLAAEVEGAPLVVVKTKDEISVFSGTCPHQGGMLSDGYVAEGKISCGLHGWAFDLKSGVNVDSAKEGIKKFKVTIEKWDVLVDKNEILEFKNQKSSGSGEKAKKATTVEPHVEHIQELAKNGLSKVGHHGHMGAMGVPIIDLPKWDDIQIITAQLAKLPKLDNEKIGTELLIGPRAKKPLKLDIPIFVSDMSFGSLSFEAKIALAKGAELAGTGICSGEGGMLAEEQEANSRYFYELASAKFGYTEDKLKKVQAFHFKGGQAAKTGTGGHLPGLKVTEKIAETRGVKVGEDAISPARFPEFNGIDDFRKFAKRVREISGGIPIGFKLSAQHIEKDIDAALEPPRTLRAHHLARKCA